MRSRRLEMHGRLAIAAALLVLLSAPAWAAPPPGDSAAAARSASAPITRDRVDALARALRDEPGLLGTQKVRELRLKEQAPASGAKRRADDDRSDWLAWLAEWVTWLNTVGRWLMWALIALGLAALLLRLRHLLGPGRGPHRDAALNLPSQVRGLDIRPASLPDDIGAAAWPLWQGGDRLATLSLLYRGALSQLVHGHALPIRDASTEGECLRLAQQRLDASALGYLQSLVGAWAEAVYAQRWPASDEVRALCEQFSCLKATPAPGSR